MPRRKTTAEYCEDLKIKYGSSVKCLEGYQSQNVKVSHILLPEKVKFDAYPKYLLSAKVPTLKALRSNVLSPATLAMTMEEYKRQLHSRFKGRIRCNHTGKASARKLIEHEYKGHLFTATPYRMLTKKVDGGFLRRRCWVYENGIAHCTTEQFHKTLKTRNVLTTEPYVRSDFKVKVTCGKCDTSWKPKAGRIFSGSSKCPRCYNINRYSKASIKWLKEVEHLLNIGIQHAENGGEHPIRLEEGNVVRIDGFSRKLNVCFEYYGDVYHGNPERFLPHETCHPFRGHTAGTLYKRTLERERSLKKLGYVVISIWERTYKRPEEYEKWKKNTILKISTLQKSLK